MTVLELTVYGRPAPQGSKRHVGGGRMIESSKFVAPWRDDVKAAAEHAIAARVRPGHDWAPLDGPLAAYMVFSLPRPAAHYGTGRNAGTLRPTAPTRPAGTPDLSKLARSTEDALTAAGLWRDDARLVEYTRLAKVYCGEDPYSLDRPGVRIIIHRAHTTPSTVDRP